MTKVNVITAMLAVLLPVMPSVALSQSIPEGFEELFELNETMVRLRNLDGSFSPPISFMTSFKSIQLNANDNEAVNNVLSYLDRNSISEIYKRQIINDLLIGIEDESLCLGKIDECQIFPETYQLVHNYNDQELYFFVAPEILTYESSAVENSYHDSKNTNNGLINSFDLFISAYEEQDIIASLNNESILGLPYGYIKTDFNITTSENRSELYEAAYHLDVDSYAVKVGHFEFEPEINSTGFLNNTARFSQNSLIIGSSEKLLIGGGNSGKVLSFYVPVSGSVHVYRDDRLIYQSNVSEGQNTISYDELPSGRYEARVDVMAGNEVLNSQTFQVYNSRNDNLAKGDLDYVMSAGMFAESHYDVDEANIEILADDLYLKGLANYQLMQSLQIGFGGLVTEHSSMQSLGAAYSMIDLGLTAEAVYSKFDSAEHVNFNIGVPYINFSYDELDNEEGDPLATHMYGYADYSRFSVNSSYGFGRGQSVYAIYSLNKDKSLNTWNSSSEQETHLLSLGYSTPTILDSMLNLNVDYSNTNDDTSVNLLWSVPLSDTVESIASVSANGSGVNQLKTTVRRNDLLESDQFSSSLEASNTYDRIQDDMHQDVSLTASGSTNYARMNTSVTTSTNNSSGVNAGLSSTQIVTGDGVYVTNKKAPAYTLIDIEQNEFEEKSVEEKGYFALKKQGKDNSKFIVYQDETIIPLQDFNSYSATFDSESVDLYNSGDSTTEVYSHPGTVVTMAPKIRRIVSFVTAFNDISEKPIKSVACHGEGCVNINEMAEGVYRVTVLEGMDFELVSDNNQCLLPYKFTSTSQLNFGQNYCLPIADTEQFETIEIEDEKLQALYLGAYQLSEDLSQAMEKLKKLGYTLIQKNIGKYKAIYIAHHEKNLPALIAEHKQEIREFKLYAKQLNSASSISFPVANVN